eukprot:970890_1
MALNPVNGAGNDELAVVGAVHVENEICQTQRRAIGSRHPIHTRSSTEPTGMAHHPVHGEMGEVMRIRSGQAQSGISQAQRHQLHTRTPTGPSGMAQEPWHGAESGDLAAIRSTHIEAFR